jgi:hypothetical protein
MQPKSIVVDEIAVFTQPVPEADIGCTSGRIHVLFSLNIQAHLSVAEKEKTF